MCLSIKINHPDDVLAEGEHQGYQWVVVNNGSGYRCGYVRVPPGHPWHGKDDMDLNLDVHGGITFGQADVPCDAAGPDDAWWVGFDCAHSCDAPDPDLIDNLEPRPFDLLRDLNLRSPRGVVRSQIYVEGECRSLCDQARRDFHDLEGV